MRKIVFLISISALATIVSATTRDTDVLKPYAVDENPNLLTQATHPKNTWIDEFNPEIPMHVTYSPEEGIKFSNADGSTYTRLSGYMQVDSANFMGDTHDTVNHRVNLHNGLYIPSARLKLRGAMNANWKYRFEYDFAKTEMDYAYLNYVGWHHIEWKVGEYRPDFSTSSLTERIDSTFIERDLATEAFFIDYAIGTQILFHKRSVTASAGIFEPAFPSVNGIAVSGGAPVGVSARLGVAPIHTQRELLHLGLASYGRQAIDSRYTQFRTYPEMLSNNDISVSLVDTGSINHSRKYMVSSAEIVNVTGPFALAADYYVTSVDRRAGRDLTFDGYYAAASYFLTGEHAVYDYLNGDFRGISKIRNTYGAWEVALRYSGIDLNDHDIHGGKENDAAIALNWYPFSAIKFGVNYIRANAAPSQNGVDRIVNIVGLMMQARFG